MADLGSRIRQVLSEKGISQAQLARMVGIKQQTVSYICAPDSVATTSRYAAAIARALGVNPNWLQAGVGDKHDPTVRIELEGVEINIDRVPLLGGRDIEAFLAGENVNPNRRLMTDIPAGRKSFAYEIQDECMKPTFFPRDRVIIDPSISPVPGDHVIATVDGNVVFRKYRLRGAGTFELVPLNDDWPTIRSSDGKQVEIVGVMVEHRSYRERR